MMVAAPGPGSTDRLPDPGSRAVALVAENGVENTARLGSKPSLAPNVDAKLPPEMGPEPSSPVRVG